MLKMVDGTGIIGVDMICPLGVSTPQPPNYDRVELEGAGMLVLPNSLDAQLERLELGGKTEQVQTSGKNLFNGKILAGKYPTDDMNIYEDKPTTNIFDKPVEIKPDTEYIISADGRLVEGNIYIYDEAGKKITEHYSGKFTSPSNAKYVVASGSNTYMTVNSAVQIEYGSTISSYEPYTGGKPSPSTEYPQEIKSVGQWNEEKQKYEVDVKVIGKNLLNEEHFFDMKNWKNNQYNMRLQPNTQYVFSRRDNVGYGSNIFLSIKNTKDDRFSQIINSNYQPSNKQSVKFKTKETGLVWFLVQNNSGINLKDMLGYAQIEVGEISTEHELYKEQTLTLTSDRQITKWDRLVEQGGQIGWLYAGVVIDRFDGQSNKISIANKKGDVQNFSIQFDNVPNGNGNTDIFIDKYRAVQLSYTKAEYGICCNWNDGVKYFSAPNENVATVDEFKAWLVENPLKIAYETTKTEFVPLPQSEQNAIRALKTYYPTTVITVDGGGLDPDIKVTYRKEI